VSSLLSWLLGVASLGLLLSGCAPAEQSPPEPDPPEILRILQANVGNLDEFWQEGCPSAPYHGAQCELAVEQEIRAHIDAIEPDIAFLMEVIDADLCPEESWDGEEGLACTGAPDREPYQQARRLVGDGYTIVCDGIAHYDCVAVRADRIALDQCPAGEVCIGAAITPEHPPDCATNGGITSVSRADAELDGLRFGIVAAHPLNATSTSDDACRLAQYQLAFEVLPGAGPTLVAGDMNLDSYRTPTYYASGRYWHEQVGEGLRFVAHSVTEVPPTPTWGDFFTLDYVLSDFLVGHDCTVLGAAPGTEPLDGALDRMDHRAVVCDLELPATE
jgi:hypothetical protein